MKQLPKYEQQAKYFEDYGGVYTSVVSVPSKDGDWVKKEDLVDWLYMHLREGRQCDVYSDLLEQLCVSI